MGKNMRNILGHLRRCGSWVYTSPKDRATKRAINSLWQRGLVQINLFGEVRACD